MPRPASECKGDIAASPHDPEARYGHKGHSWIGYKLYVSESADADQSRFITDVRVTPALIPDNQEVAPIQTGLAERQTMPAQQYVDQGYMSAANIVESAQRGVDFRGFIKEDTQAKPG